MEDDVGNRFHPTDEEIILHYLEGKMQGIDFSNVIGVIDICKFEPWNLPEQAAWQSNDPVWYFFSEPDYKYANSTRFNRRTTAGYWKPTGKECLIRDKDGRDIGVKKNLVFYRGCFKKGVKTNWTMNEYHSNNANSYQKPYVLYRLKQKSDDDGSEVCDGPSHETASQGNPRQPELESLPHESEVDYDFFSQVLSQQQHPAAQGPSYSTGSNNEPNAWRSHMNTSYTFEQEFVNSLLADQEGAYLFEQTLNTHLHGFNPPKSLTRVSGGDSSYTEAETADSQLQCELKSTICCSMVSPIACRVLTNLQWGNVLEIPSFSSGNASSKEYKQIRMVQTPQSKKPRINCIQSLSDEFPVETRTCKVQHLPKSHNIKKKSAPERLYLQGKVSNKEESRDEVRGEAKLVIHLPRKKNCNVKYVKDQRIAQSSEKTSWKMRSNGGRKDYIIFLEPPPFGQKPNPPTVYVGNILLAVVLFIIMIREMKSLH